MTRVSKKIEFIKDKVGKYFIKANSIVTASNIPLDETVTILFEGDTTSNFTLADYCTNYDYIEVIWRPHPSLGQCSDRMIPSKGDGLHLERAHSINGVTTVYRCQLTFSGKSVTLSGRTQVINGNGIDAVEEHILRVIGYKY
ncbi:hypothetical protein [Thomasclavelia ramosa]|uniref:hypothetical protein n=1 Tax=Thomasclavelia ramosa TaxID=1547 RepID=UPI0036F1A11C